MAKTYKGLYPRIYDFENLYAAYLKAREGKRYKKDVLEFSAHLEENLIQLQNELIWHAYKTGTYNSFYVYEPKKRLIMALPFRDRVIHHAICNIIEPIWERRFIYDSYACRSGKGIHAGVKRLTYYLRRCERIWGKTYCLKGDVSKYFLSIDHIILKRLLQRRIACPETLSLCGEIIDSVEGYAGIPIGNLTSQLFANIYLHELDKFVKHTLKERYYIRYMDDFVILSPDKIELFRTQKNIEEFIWENLRLKLNDKTQIFPVKSQGIDFLGYRIWPTHILPRKRTLKKARKRFKILSKLYKKDQKSLDEITASVMSFLGYMKHCNGYYSKMGVLRNIKLS